MITAAGKTHLAAAIANHRAQLGDPPLFVMVPDLLDHLRATFSPNSQTTFDRRFDEIRTTPLLVLDDLGTQSMTPWVREKLYQLFNYRYNAELPTVITIAADSLEELDARIRSRLLDTRFCKIIGITAPAYRGKIVKRPKNRRDFVGNHRPIIFIKFVIKIFSNQVPHGTILINQP